MIITQINQENYEIKSVEVLQNNGDTVTCDILFDPFPYIVIDWLEKRLPDHMKNKEAFELYIKKELEHIF